MKRLVVFASGRGSNFARVVDACAAGELDATVTHLVCNVPDAGAIEIARQAGVTPIVLNHRDYASRAAHEQAVVEALAGVELDLVVLAGYMRVLGPTLLTALHDERLGHARIVNIHPADPQAYKGADGYGWAIAQGVRETAVTVHWVDAGVDTGPLIASARVPVQPDDDVAALRERGLLAEHVLYPQGIRAALARLQEVHAPCAAF